MTSKVSLRCDVPGHHAVADDFGHEVVAVSAGEFVVQLAQDVLGGDELVAFEDRAVFLFREIRAQGGQHFEHRNALLQAEDFPDAQAGAYAVRAQQAQMPAFLVRVEAGQHEEDVGAVKGQSLGQAEARRAEAARYVWRELPPEHEYAHDYFSRSSLLRRTASATLHAWAMVPLGR